jgi:hypothetical protein
MNFYCDRTSSLVIWELLKILKRKWLIYDGYELRRRDEQNNGTHVLSHCYTCCSVRDGMVRDDEITPDG